MVGVRRSKGCSRCRGQKKGCDLKRPSCSNCARLSATCSYEAKKVQFIPSSIPAVHSTAVGRTSQSPTITQPWCLDKTALELEAEDEFWTAYLPDGGKDKTVGLDSVSWEPIIRRFSQQDGLTKLAFQALSITTLGRLRKDTSLLKQGSELYTRALRRMNVTLKQPEQARRDSVLATAQLLGTYEIFRGDVISGISSQGADWQRHIDGALQLVDLRIKNGEMTDESWELLRHARESAIMSGGISSRPANKLAANNHKASDRPTLQIQDELFDILYPTPQVLHDIDRCLKGLAEAKEEPERQLAIEEAVRVLQSAVVIGGNLYAWECRTLASCLEEISFTPKADGAPSGLPNLFSVCRDYGYGVFRAVMFYCWAAVSCYTKAWLTYRYLIQHVGYETLEKLTDLPLLPTFMDPHPYALRIRANISHFFRPEAGLWGAQQAVLPMVTAMLYFAATDGEFGVPTKEALERMMSVSTSKEALIVFGFVQGVAALAIPGESEWDMTKPADLRRMAREWFGFRHEEEPQEKQ